LLEPVPPSRVEFEKIRYRQISGDLPDHRRRVQPVAGRPECFRRPTLVQRARLDAQNREFDK